METLSRDLHGYKLKFRKHFSLFQSCLRSLEYSDDTELVQKDIEYHKTKADYYSDLIHETKQKITKEWKKDSAKRRAVDPKLMNEFYNLKDCYLDCKRCGKDFKHFNHISNSYITEEEYKSLHASKDFADLMRALKIMAENKINKL
jgi:hypothetical protein